MRVLKKNFFTGTGRLWCDMLSKLLFFAECCLTGAGEKGKSPHKSVLS